MTPSPRFSYLADPAPAANLVSDHEPCPPGTVIVYTSDGTRCHEKPPATPAPGPGRVVQADYGSGASFPWRSVAYAVVLAGVPILMLKVAGSGLPGIIAAIGTFFAILIAGTIDQLSRLP